MGISLWRSERKKMTPGQSVVCTAFMVLVGIGFMTAMVVRGWQQEAVASWPTVQGSMTEAATVYEYRRKGGTRLGVRMKYTYVLNDREYTGTHYRLYGERLTAEERDEVVRRLPLGAKVNVYYDPDEPKTCCLEPGAPETAWMPIAFAGLFTGLAGLMCVKFWFAYRRGGAM